MKQQKPVKVFVIAAVTLIVMVCAFLAYTLFLSYEDSAKGENDVILNPNVVVYSEKSSNFAITSYDETSITVNSSEGLEIGDVLNAGITETTPVGLLRKITAIDENGEEYVLQTSPAALTDAIERCDFSAEVLFDSDGVVHVAGEETPPTDTSIGIQKAYADESASKLFSCTTASVELSASLKLILELKIESGEVHFKAAFQPQGSFSIELKEQIEASLNLLGEKGFHPFELHKGIELVFSPSIKADYNASATLDSLTFEANANLDHVIGFEYDTPTGIRGINEDFSQTPAFSLANEADLFEIETSQDVSLHFDMMIFGIAGPSLGVSLIGDGSIELQSIGAGESTDDAISIPGLEGEWKGSLTGKVYVPVWGEFIFDNPGKAFNIFDATDSELSIELFNSEDAITLFETAKQFGEVIKPYEYYENEYFKLAIPQEMYPYFSAVEPNIDEYVLDDGTIGTVAEYSFSYHPAEDYGSGMTVKVFSKALIDAMNSDMELSLVRFLLEDVSSMEVLGEGYTSNQNVEYENGASNGKTSNGDQLYVIEAGASFLGSESEGIILIVK